MSILEKFCSQTHLTFTKELARRDAGSFQSPPFVECLNAVKNNKQFFNYAMFIIRLAPWTAKMNLILHCDWLPERVRLSYLARSGLPTVSRKDNFPESHIINPLLTKLVRSRRLNIRLVLFFLRDYDFDPVSVHKHAKRNLADIQPSSPHTWSITHRSFAHGHHTWDWTRRSPFWWRNSAVIRALSLTGCCSDLNFREQVSTNQRRHSNLCRPALPEWNFLRRMLNDYILGWLTYF